MPDCFDLVPGAGGVLKKVFKSSQAGIKLGKTINKVRSRLGNKTDALKAAARRKAGKAADHPFAIRVKSRVFPTRRVGKLPPNSSRAQMPKAEKERVTKTTDHLGDSCFVPGTLVDTGEGFRVIESLKKDDLVWAKDEFTGEVALKPITRVMERVAPSTLVLTFSNDEIVETTIEHPFYVQGEGFTPAGLVAIGNSIVTRAGPSLQVTAIEKHSSPHKVYNFEVRDFHTYFVSQSKLWVHNITCRELWDEAKDFADSFRNVHKDLRPSTTVSIEVRGHPSAFKGRSSKGLTSQQWENQIHPDVKKLYDDVPANIKQSNATHLKCAEVMALSEIYRQGLQGQLQGGKAFSTRVRGPNSSAHGTAKEACASCRHVLARLGATDVGGIVEKASQ